ncbi:degenerin unc-8 [Parasteatoda tepidariorum]|uniref:degenerin unc-8 n=1 Tax=Parasteatoda tepidariorum TaxID=114398 RepID=UPI00077FE045|nr:uncharacterized protein LOC107452668 [Parasteatoda tepidariorum]
MSEEISNERIKKTSVVKYASDIFKESSLSALTGILTTGSIKRKIFKSFIFLIFTIAFIYQVITFLSYVLEFPTVVNIDIVKPEKYIAPAYTLCHSQKMRRSKYCEKYPDHCSPTDDSTDIRVKDEYLRNASEKDIFLFGYGLDEMVLDIERRRVSFSEEPVLRQRSFSYFRDDYVNDFSLCVTTELVVNSQDDPPMDERKNYFTRTFVGSERLFLNSHEADMFDPNVPPGIYFSVHTPYDAVNPFQNGHFLSPGMQYKITIKMKEEKLLRAPYKTDCMDYVELWKENRRTGPRSQEMCIQKCVVDFISQCFNCTFVAFTYPSEAKSVCSEGVLPKLGIVCNDENDKVPKCVNACKEECLKIIYTIDVRSRKIPYDELFQHTENFSDGLSRQIIVDVEVDDREILRYEYSAKYQDVEAFSYIGGFIGIWLGISLVQMTDFIESIFLIGRYFFKKASCDCKLFSEKV